MVLHAGLDPVLAGRDLTTEPRNVGLAFCQDGLRAGPHLCRCARCGEQRIWLVIGRRIIIRGCRCVSGGGSGGTDRGASCSGTPSRVGRGDDRRPAIVGATVVVGAAAIIGTATVMVAVGTVDAAVIGAGAVGAGVIRTRAIGAAVVGGGAGRAVVDTGGAEGAAVPGTAAPGPVIGAATKPAVIGSPRESLRRQRYRHERAQRSGRHPFHHLPPSL